jgi:hypothetical protein
MRPPTRAPLLTSVFASLVVAVLAAGGTSANVPDSEASAREAREMRELVLKLQDQIDAQQRQLDRQRARLDDAALAERGSGSGLSSFLETTDFSGWVAASYFYNFNNPRNPSSGGNGPFANTFHPDHNSFQLDEAWFVVDRPATEASPAGFHFEIVYGATASVMQGDSAHLSGDDFWIPAANVSYRTPWGQTVTAGKLKTPIGYEVAGAPNNVNITRGLTYALFQPISHTGATVSQSFDNGLTYTLGMVNGFGTEQPDSNLDKGWLWQLGWRDDAGALLLNGFYSNELEGDPDDRILLDLVAELVPADNLLMWLNVDYLNTRQDGENPWGIGVSLGGRIAVREDLGVGTRIEYAHFDANGVATYTDGNGDVRFLDGDLWALTGTLDYAFNDELTGKVEVKYEKGGDGLGGSYKDGNSSSSGNAVLVGTQLYYEF